MKIPKYAPDSKSNLKGAAHLKWGEKKYIHGSSLTEAAERVAFSNTTLVAGAGRLGYS